MPTRKYSKGHSSYGMFEDFLIDAMDAAMFSCPHCRDKALNDHLDEERAKHAEYMKAYRERKND